LPLTSIEGLKPGGREPYAIEINEVPDQNGDGAIDLSDVEYLLKHNANTARTLNGDDAYNGGDFRSQECVALLEQADIVVTNPPFSLFREYVAQLVKYDKQFLIVGNQNAITYKGIFPLIQANKLWLGTGFSGNCAHFVNKHYEDFASATDHRDGMIRVSGVSWFTNMDNPKRHEELKLYKKYTPSEYPKYDNYNAIEVGKVVEIPVDYTDVMGVPITFLNKYNSKQFEILGATESEGKGFSNGLWLRDEAQAVVNGKRVYKRLFIKRKEAAPE
jgi:hypothetical protein